MRHHKITSGGRAKRLSASAGRSQDKKFQQVSSRNAKDTTPNNGGEPIVNALPDREPAECISHEFTDMSKLGNAANHPSSRPKNAMYVCIYVYMYVCVYVCMYTVSQKNLCKIVSVRTLSNFH